jgi:hypothetical protein
MAALLGALAAIAVPWYFVAKTLRDVRPVIGSPATSVFWGSRYFNTDADLSRWLHARGARYRIWALRHPHAAARIGSSSPAS